MSIFDHAARVSDRLALDVMGDPIRIRGGDYNTGDPVMSRGVLSYAGAEDANGFVHSTVPFVEYQKDAWTNPQRGDVIEFIGPEGAVISAWRIAKVRAQSNLVMTVDVSPA